MDHNEQFYGTTTRPNPAQNGNYRNSIASPSTTPISQMSLKHSNSIDHYSVGGSGRGSGRGRNQNHYGQIERPLPAIPAMIQVVPGVNHRIQQNLATLSTIHQQHRQSIQSLNQSMKNQLDHYNLSRNITNPHNPSIDEYNDERYLPPPSPRSLKPPGRISNPKQLFLGSTVLVVGLIFFVAFDPIVYGIMDYELSIQPGRIFTWIWKRNPIPINMDFILFELKNGEDFLRGAKPLVAEIGPFCYEAFRTRKVIDMNKDTVKFTEKYELKLIPDKSSPRLHTKFKSINYPIFATMVLAKKIMGQFFVSFLAPIVLNVINIMLQATGETLIDNRTPYELLEGRQINLVAYMEFFLQPLRDSGIPIPAFKLDSFELINGTFGFIPIISSAELGPIEAYTTTENGHVASHIFRYGDSDKIPLYKYPCNRLHGSGAILYGHHVNKTRLYVYTRLTCRPLVFKKARMEYFKGTQTIRYELDDQQYNSSVPSNQCFCVGRSLRKCNGWSSVEGCYGGVNAALSFPHFYNSPDRQSELLGLKPDRTKHVGYMNIEPNIGVPVNADLTFQANLFLDSVRWVPQLSRTPSVVYPIFWIRAHLSADPYQAFALFFAIKGLLFGSYLVLAGCLLVGTVLIMKSMKQLPTNRVIDSNHFK